MSMEAYALCAREVRSIEEWQAIIDRLDFKVVLSPAGDINGRGGFLPATWQGQEAGFECTKFSFPELRQVYPRIDFGRSWPFAYAFYFHTFTGCVGTWFSLAACIELTGGLAFDPQEDRLFSADAAVRHAKETEADFYRLKDVV